MKEKDIFEIVEKQGYELNPLHGETYLRLFVEGDENDGDYISNTYDFDFSEIDKIQKIQDALLELPEQWQEDFDWDKDDEKDGFDLTDYIPSGSQEFVHTITIVSIDTCINGKIYELNKK